MNNIPTIHGDKTPQRIHYIVEWAEERRLQQKDIVNEIGADKGLVSRWFSGTVPKPNYLEALRQLFELDDISELFRHPNDDWMSRLLRGKSEVEKKETVKLIDIIQSLGDDDREAAIRMLENMPRKRSA